LIYVIFNEVTRSKPRSCPYVTAKRIWGSGGIAPFILNLGSWWQGVAIYTSRLTYTRGRSPRYPFNGKLLAAVVVLKGSKICLLNMSLKLRFDSKNYFVQAQCYLLLSLALFGFAEKN
jgi:hypothetical protein